MEDLQSALNDSMKQGLESQALDESPTGLYDLQQTVDSLTQRIKILEESEIRNTTDEPESQLDSILVYQMVQDLNQRVNNLEESQMNLTGESQPQTVGSSSVQHESANVLLGETSLDALTQNMKAMESQMNIISMKLVNTTEEIEGLDQRLEEVQQNLEFRSQADGKIFPRTRIS